MKRPNRILSRGAFAALLFAAISGVSALSSPSAAAFDAASRQALVVVRFNQPRVSFERSLQTAVSRALAIKPDATFDVLRSVPAVSSRPQKQAERDANLQLARVITAMRDAGADEKRIRLHTETVEGLGSVEVRVFVE